MSIVKDMSLAPSGRQKIQWVRDFRIARRSFSSSSALRVPSGFVRC